MRFVTLIFSILLIIQQNINQSIASCVGRSIEEKLRLDDYIFSGRITESRDSRTGMPVSEQTLQIDWLFEVGLIWKGTLPDTVWVSTSTMWGPRFTVGDQFLVYAEDLARRRSDAERPALYTGQCSGSKRVDRALWDRYHLPDPRIVKPALNLAPVTISDFLAGLNGDDHFLAGQCMHHLTTFEEDRDMIIRELGLIIRGQKEGNISMALCTAAYLGAKAQALIPAILGVLQEKEPLLRRCAYSAVFSVLEPDLSWQFLWGALTDPSASYRGSTWYSASRIYFSLTPYNQRCLAKILEYEIVHERDPNMKREALRVLSDSWNSWPEWFCDLLVELEKSDPDGRVRNAARTYLGRLDPDCR
ncbi:MAG: hypothetical protein ABIF77_15740 [bacterium]